MTRAWVSKAASVAGLAASMLGSSSSVVVRAADAVAQPAAQGRHALLIGIGQYAVKPLEGPVFDVRSLAAILRDTYSFTSVRVLEDGQGTRAGILKALDELTATTRPGDLIFVYYSGHGTSAMDRQLRLPGLTSFTGALLPSGFKPGTQRDMLSQIVTGARDLRPRFEKLEQDREVIVAFDTCFSANTVRSLRIDGGSASRSIPWDRLVSTRSGGVSFDEDAAPAEFGNETVADGGYPYRNTLYLSAAGLGEEAEDIESRRLALYPTVDGQPHGAMTNALLKGLAGSADTNGDSVLSYRELFEFVRNEVTRSFPHTPQLSVPVGRDDLLDRPVFNARGVSRPAVVSPAPAALRVLARPGDVDAQLRSAISAIPNVALVASGTHDLRVTSAPPSKTLVLHGSGDLLSEYVGEPAHVRREVTARVTRQARAHQLLNQTFPAQDFNVSVNIDAPRGYLVVGETAVIRYSSEVPAYLLIVNVDAGGYVSVVHPGGADEVRPVTGNLNTNVKVTEPTGTEFVKVFAFQQLPAGLAQWAGQGFEADTPSFDALMAMVRSARGRRAQGILKLVTSTKVQ